MNKEKTGIFGGTFNPPHIGHKRLALSAANALGLDRVLIMPACIPPHKQPAFLAEPAQRLEMCRLGLKCDSRFEVSDLEIKRGDKSYTVDTVNALLEQYPGTELYIIIGSDMLSTFREWFKWEEILQKAFICAVSRENGFAPDLSGYTPEQREKIIYLDIEPYEMSSTVIREKIMNGESTEGLLVPGVERFIKESGLYAESFTHYRELIRGLLDPARLNHSFCVAAAARELALIYGADPDKAEAAGLLHDVMKNASPEEQRSIIEAGGHTLTPCEEANRKVWHAIAGEAYLRLKEGITDKEILSAVRWHTTGRADMTLLDKIVYMADFISAERSYPDVDTVRELAKKDLNEAILYTSSYTIRTLVEAGRPLHTATVECFNSALLNK